MTTTHPCINTGAHGTNTLKEGQGQIIAQKPLAARGVLEQAFQRGLAVQPHGFDQTLHSLVA